MSAPFSPAEQNAAVLDFVRQWTGKGYERGQTQPFWLDLLRVLGVDNPSAFIEFEDAARMDEAHGFIDAYIPSTHVLVEQKKLSRDLRAPIRQSDGTLLTPFQQARRYAATLPYSQRPRWIVTCNFAEFHVYDMENPNAEPESIRLADLPDELYRLRFLVNAASDRVAREMEVSIEAGRIVGRIHDALLAQYGDPTPEILHWLNVLCVRLVFCLYAEDAGIFADDQFHDYLAAIPTHRLRQALLDLFAVLDTPKEARSRYLDPGLAAFPYVDGSLFSGPVEIPQFTEELRTALLEKASLGFDWAEISPTIFGAVFESTLNPETRRSGGMHYTSIENIHKVIDPLFLDALRAELNGILEMPVPRQRNARLRAFQEKLAAPAFLDPACGSGNFLTETYLSLRRLENEAIAALIGPQSLLDLEGGEIRVKVSIAQFYGIEINDFAVSVARTALWIAESQMLAQTAVLLHRDLDFLPLKSYDNIREGNALRMDWAEGLGSRKFFDYIIGNPPFVGFTFQSAEQKADMEALFPKVKNLDFVCGWFKKAADLIKGTRTECAFVATNTVTQGETVARFRELVDLTINFAYQSFVWDSESNAKAHVHCVILGFADFFRPDRYLFDGPRKRRCTNINPYLLDAPDILVKPQTKAFHQGASMVYGNKPADGGHLIIEDADLADFLRRDPQASKFIWPLLGAEEYLHGKKRWCLWLDGANPADLKACPLVMERIRKCRETRESSIAAGIRKFAATPSLFAQRTQPLGKPFIILPCHSSETRRYVPMGFLDGRQIATNAVQVIPEATVYEFGVLTSNVHMAWMRAVCGRLESRYRYNKEVVYNTFPWPTPTDTQKARIEQTAQGILDARAQFPDTCLADLYDPLLTPPALLNAHRANDRAVMTAYGFDVKMTESDCVAELFKLYERLTARA